jgi:glucose/arabinose dehydrogenase
MGDGGSGGDPLGHGQDKETLLGTILRIDVSSGTSYSIPDDNPFVGSSGADEIYAYGLRNPWRFHFDKQEGTLWTGDVGQDQYEEIDIIISGGNYGWNIREGMHCYDAWDCDTDGMIDPVAEYNHAVGYSVTGGYVYRGTELTSLSGKYLYADYGSGNVWTLTHNTGSADYTSEALLANTGKTIASFAEDLDGEMYIVSLYTGEFLKLIETIE